jgi:circadian clock protein KaiB
MSDGQTRSEDAAEEIPSEEAPWQLRLYVCGRTAMKTIVTLQNLTELCEKHLQGRYVLDLVDLLEEPDRVEEDKILAIPTLVRRSPQPVRKVIGDLSNTAQVITSLGLPRRDSLE